MSRRQPEFTQRPKETDVALRPTTSISLSSGQRTTKEFTQRPKETDVALRPTTSISLSSGQRTAKESLWLRLSERAKADLSAKGFDERWFAARSTQDGLAIVNNYAKLLAYSLWDLVESEVEVSSGCLDFCCADVEALRTALAQSKAFSNPGPLAAWTSRELVRTSSLHFKHFEGWPQDQVQVHVDGHGSRLRWWWWLFPPLIAWQVLRHLQHYESYRDVHTTFGRLSPLFERLGVFAVWD